MISKISMCACLCISVVLNWGRFCPYPTKESWQCLETFFIVSSSRGILGYRPRMLLNNQQCTGQIPQQRIIQPNMSTMPRLRNLNKYVYLGICICVYKYIFLGSVYFKGREANTPVAVSTLSTHILMSNTILY